MFGSCGSPSKSRSTRYMASDEVLEGQGWLDVK